jgi:hypothetical protein
MAGSTATPEWERFRGSVQGSLVDWVRAQEGVMDAMNSAPTNDKLTSLNIHPNFCDLNLVIIESL